MIDTFVSSIEHLSAELGRLDVLLQRELALARRVTPESLPEEFRGLVITEGEIDALAKEPDYVGERWRHAAAMHDVLHALDEHATLLKRAIDIRCQRSHEAGVRLAFAGLVERAGLSPQEADLLLLAVAPELEPRYETLYAYIQNDVTRKRPSVDLALNMISRSAEQKLTARKFVEPRAPLLAHHLVTLGEESVDRQPPLLRKFLKAHEDVVAMLLDQWTSDAVEGEFVGAQGAEPIIDVDARTREALAALVDQSKQPRHGPMFVRLAGDSPAALREVARWIAFQCARPLLIAALGPLNTDVEQRASFVRSAVLADCFLAITATVTPDVQDSAHGSELASSLQRELRAIDTIVLLLAHAGTFVQLPNSVNVWHVDIPRPDFEQRRARWMDILPPSVGRQEIGRLADSFRLERSEIVRTVALGERLGAVRHPTAPEPTLPDLFDAGRLISTPRLQRFTVPISPRVSWDDIVLPREKIEQLQRIARWKRLRHRVHEDWGFGARVARGQGLNVLFTGPPGTGKTLAAEVLAKDLGLDLFQIDLSTVVSKYIGQTEKNLSAIFGEADQTQSILFFDEADALFGKRTEVRDAHDRYANVEINFLLQRLEQYDGIVILATNMRRNVDEAFVRRLNDVVDFPVPDEDLRERIWRTHFPRDDIRAADVDLAFLAQQFKLTGGSIRNIVLDAAFRAAAASRRIDMSHLLEAVKAELAKQGRLPTKAELGRYYTLIEREPPVAALIGR
jgi:hypothetical protein